MVDHTVLTFLSAYLITVLPPRSTRCSSLHKLARPFTASSLRITDRSFQYASLRLCSEINSRLLSVNHAILIHAVLRVPVLLPLVASTHHSPSLFHSRLKNRPFLQIFPAFSSSTDSPDCLPILLRKNPFLLFSLSFFPLSSFGFRSVDLAD